LRTAHEQSVIADEYKQAKAMVDQARAQLLLGLASEAEATFRGALVHLRRAFNWSDRDHEILHQLHTLGREIHDRFGCKLAFRKGAYQIECPVRLAHIPYGMSVGGSSKSICRICGMDPFECEHVRGRSYDGVIAMRIGKTCNICLEESCEHIPGTKHDGIDVVHIVTDLQIHEISVVPSPAMPDAVFEAISMPEREVRAQLDPSEAESFQLGMDLSCHHCRICEA
jgi:hypothetical protein